MANTDAPMGLRIYGHLSGGQPSRGVREFPISAAYAEELNKGDAVVLVATGDVNLAAVGERLLGVFSGCRYVDASGDQKFSKRWPSGTVATDRYAFVQSDPNCLFLIQADGATAAVDVGQLAELVVTAADTTLEQSRHELDTADQGTGSAQLRIIGKDDRPDNAWGLNVDLIVQIYLHEFTGADAGTPGV